jgi:hypothetical protein
LEETKAEIKAREKRVNKLNNEIDKLSAEIEDIESGRLYENALEWRFEFPEVLNDDGDFVGFDAIIGNPPYIRQEEIKELKPTLQKDYKFCYTGIADLFVYFYELGLNLLKIKGYLTYISSNKYFRAGYGQKLRQFLTDSSTIHNLIDFGDYPVFEEAIAYPSIITLSKAKSENNQVQALAWDETKKQDIAQFATVLEQDGLIISQENLKPDGWRLESSENFNLLDKLRNAGKPLGEYVNGKFYYGIKTGFNEAFVIDRATRDRLIKEHSSSSEVIKPFLRGRDVKRWNIDFADQYLIKIESSENKKHFWSEFTEKEAEKIFEQTYPAIYKHFSQFRDSLIKRCDQGRFFWELRSCIYWQEFEQPKIIYPDIAVRSEFTFDNDTFLLDCTLFLIPSDSKYLLGVLNSSITRFFINQICPTIRGDFRRFKSIYISQIPIINTTKSQRTVIETLVGYVLYLTTALKDIPSSGKEFMASADDQLMLSYFEQIIDAAVMELYLPDELHAGDKYFMRHLLQETLLNIDKIKGDKMIELRVIFRRIFDRDHPIRTNIYFLGNIDIVKIITGKV